MLLTPHFSLEEFTASSKALEIHDANAPNEYELGQLYGLAVFMEQVRHVLGDESIAVTSAFRNARVNAAVGGVSDSDHRLARACDFRHSRLTARECCIRIRASQLMWDQLILETSRSVVHIGIGARMRRQVLTQAGEAGSSVVEGIA